MHCPACHVFGIRAPGRVAEPAAALWLGGVDMDFRHASCWRTLRCLAKGQGRVTYHPRVIWRWGWIRKALAQGSDRFRFRFRANRPVIRDNSAPIIWRRVQGGGIVVPPKFSSRMPKKNRHAGLGRGTDQVRYPSRRLLFADDGGTFDHFLEPPAKTALVVAAACRHQGGFTQRGPKG